MLSRIASVAGLAAAALAATIPAWAQKGPLQKISKGEGRVDIVAWAGYIERGATDKKFDWVTDFEGKTGCKVSVKTAGTSDEMVALMNEGGFDLVTASGDASSRLIRGKKVAPINVGLLPSYKNIDARLQKAPWHFENNTHYGVPYQWGWNVLMYNTQVFKDKPPTSWSVVFEETTLPDGKSNKGRVQAFDGPIHIADAALYLMKKNPALGIKDPYELNEAQYKAALDVLRAQRKIVGKYWHDAFVQIDDFTNEGVVASGSWQFQANILKSKNRPIATTIPVEGASGWADSTMLHAEAKNPNCAYMWLEHSLNPKLQGDLSAWFGSVPAVPAAVQGQCVARRRGLRAPGLQRLRPDLVLEDADHAVQEPERPVRSVSQVGQRLHRGAGRPLTR
jgi:putative spermidine/putrescine transport system substrate-binding protein